MKAHITQQDQAKTPKKTYFELLQTLAFVLLIVFILRSLLFQPFTIPSSSMQPALIEGDYIITSKYSLGYGPKAAAPIALPFLNDRVPARAPKRGDIIVFYTDQENKPYIKRLLGLPGEKLAVSNGIVYINGLALAQTLTDDEDIRGSQSGPALSKIKTETLPSGKAYLIFDDIENSPRDNMAEITIPGGYYFFLGDNRDYSKDSRMRVDEGGTGLVASANLIGRAEFILFSAEPGFKFYNPRSWRKLRRQRAFKGL